MSLGANENTQNSIKLSTKPYGKVTLTLKNQLLPDDKLSITPSQSDGLDSDTETDLRIYGCELIQTAGILLKLPQVGVISLSTVSFPTVSHVLKYWLISFSGGNGNGASVVTKILLLKKLSTPPC